jgi:hypothetical protein
VDDGAGGTAIIGEISVLIVIGPGPSAVYALSVTALPPSGELSQLSFAAPAHVQISARCQKRLNIPVSGALNPL